MTDPRPFSTADLYDERGEQLISCPRQFLDLGGTRAFTGPVRTVRCFQDNALLRSILNSPGEGAVLVVDGHGSLGTALMGDLIGEAAVRNGWAGVIVNGAVRDRLALAQLPLGVKALGSNPRKSAKEGTGEPDVPVVIEGTTFVPGRTVWADEDGVLVES